VASVILVIGQDSSGGCHRHNLAEKNWRNYSGDHKPLRSFSDTPHDDEELAVGAKLSCIEEKRSPLNSSDEQKKGLQDRSTKMDAIGCRHATPSGLLLQCHQTTPDRRKSSVAVGHFSKGSRCFSCVRLFNEGAERRRNNGVPLLRFGR